MNLRKKHKIMLIIIVVSCLIGIQESSYSGKRPMGISSIPVAGDVNNDGIVTREDADLICRKAAGEDVSVAMPDNGDVNRNGLLDITDALLTGQKIKGLYTAAPPMIHQVVSIQGSSMIEGIARKGDEIRIFGESLVDSTTGCWVLIDDTPFYPLAQSYTFVSIKIPDEISPSQHKIKMQAGFNVSNELDLFITDGPIIANITPQYGPAGTVITISGAGFSQNLYENILYFGNIRAEILNTSTGSITTIVPSISNQCDVTVEVSGKLSNKEQYYFKADNLLNLLRLATNKNEIAYVYRTILLSMGGVFSNTQYSNFISMVSVNIDAPRITLKGCYDYLSLLNQELINNNAEPLFNPSIKLQDILELLSDALNRFSGNQEDTVLGDLILFFAPYGNIIPTGSINQNMLLFPIQMHVLMNWLFDQFQGQENVNEVNKVPSRISSLDNNCMKNARTKLMEAVNGALVAYGKEIEEFSSNRLWQEGLAFAAEEGAGFLLFLAGDFAVIINIIDISHQIDQLHEIIDKMDPHLKLGEELKNYSDKELYLKFLDDIKFMDKMWENTVWRIDEYWFDFLQDIEKCSEPEIESVTVNAPCQMVNVPFSGTIKTHSGAPPKIYQIWKRDMIVHDISEISYKFQGVFSEFPMRYDIKKYNDKTEETDHNFEFKETIPSVPLNKLYAPYYYDCIADVWDLGGQTAREWKHNILHVVAPKFKFINLSGEIHVNDKINIDVIFYGHDGLTPEDGPDVSFFIDRPGEKSGLADFQKIITNGGRIEIRNLDVGPKPGEIHIRTITDYRCPFHPNFPHSVTGDTSFQIGKYVLNLYISKHEPPQEFIKEIPLRGSVEWAKGSDFFDYSSIGYNVKAELKDKDTGKPISGKRITIECDKYPEALPEYKTEFTSEQGIAYFSQMIFPKKTFQDKVPIIVRAFIEGAERPFKDDEYDEVTIMPCHITPTIRVQGCWIVATDPEGDFYGGWIGLQRMDNFQGGLTWLDIVGTWKQDDPTTIDDETEWVRWFHGNLPVTMKFTATDFGGRQSEAFQRFGDGP